MYLQAALIVVFIGAFASGSEHDHKYKLNEEVTLWVNKVGPYHNPQETYKYYSLPFCRPTKTKETKYKSDGLGSAIDGNELEDSGIHIKFREDIDDMKVCELSLDVANAAQFSEAIRNHYWYQMYVDELPIFGMVGQMMVPHPSAGGVDNTPEPFIYTHRTFSISYNEDQIIELNLTSDKPINVKPGQPLSFTLSVKWHSTASNFEDRFDRYLDFNFFEHQIHWFSIFNSFMMVIFLCGLVVLILMRTLRNDYIRYTEDDELELDRVIDESGWKQVHGDVFRQPPSLMLFSALIGTGYQLMVLAFLSIVLAIVGRHYMGRGRVIGNFISMYSLTSFISGYVSGSFYKRNGGTDWKQTMMLTATLFPGLAFGILMTLNLVAVGYQTLAALSVGTLFSMLLIWALVCVTLVVVGTVIGRNTATKDDFPCRVNSIRRPIPECNWYTHPATLSLAGGVLPFGSIFIEMYFIFTSFWNYKFYYVYGFMLLVYVILIIVTMCVTIVACYCLLNAENYHWHWTCFFCGGSTSLYVMLYAVYYFFTKTKMYGFFQICFYFGYMSIFCIGLFILCGSIGFLGSNLFVRRIYTYIKSD